MAPVLFYQSPKLINMRTLLILTIVIGLIASCQKDDGHQTQPNPPNPIDTLEVFPIGTLAYMYNSDTIVKRLDSIPVDLDTFYIGVVPVGWYGNILSFTQLKPSVEELLGLGRVPLVVGNYDLNSYKYMDMVDAVTVDGDQVAALYSPDSTYHSEIRVTEVDTVKQTIRGEFEGRLLPSWKHLSYLPDTITITNGAFYLRYYKG
jgi:hypothetical protein